MYCWHVLFKVVLYQRYTQNIERRLKTIQSSGQRSLYMHTNIYRGNKQFMDDAESSYVQPHSQAVRCSTDERSTCSLPQ